jgi:ATP-binding cassette, subfamily C, bacterial LapB
LIGSGASGFGEIVARFRRSPGQATAILAATAMMSILGLASSLFVMQVLNRFITSGGSGTLLMLTVGAGLALAAEHQLRALRWRLAEDVAGDQDRRLATGLFGLMLTVRHKEQATSPPSVRLELMRGVENARRALGPAGLTLVADLPFSLLVLMVLLLLSPVLAGVTAAFCFALGLSAWLDQRRSREPTARLGRIAGETNGLIAAAIQAGETVRCFRARDFMMARWRAVDDRAVEPAQQVARLQLAGGATAQAMQGALAVAIVAIGALQVVSGDMDIGTLIGANMIAGRALAPFGRIVQFGASLREATAGLAEARRFAATAATEPDGGRIIPDWRGGFRLENVAADYPDAAAPVFSGLSLAVPPGAVVAVTGRNGSGKTTLLRLLAGLDETAQGRILIDEADLRQMSPAWWRGRVSYLPQEPTFLPGTLRENLTLARPDACEADLVRCLIDADLGSFLNNHPRHLEMDLTEAGRTLSPGMRRRLGLARALVGDGVLFLLDEPTEGLDRDGAQTVYRRLIALAQAGKTLVIATHDPLIIAGATYIVDLNGSACDVRTPPPTGTKATAP